MTVVYEQAGEIQALSAKELGYKEIIRNLTDQGETFLKEIDDLKEELAIVQKQVECARVETYY